MCLDRRPGLFAENLFERDGRTPTVRTNGTAITKIPLTLTPQVASLLGYIISEGYVRKDVWGVSIPTTDPDQMELYRNSVQGIIPYQERDDVRHNRQSILEFYRSADIQALMEFGLTREKAQDKEIPFGILQSPKHIITEFLKALFDGDGGVSGCTLEYCTASTKMADQLHTLLLAYGITARRKFRPNSCLGAWHLSITGKSLRKFASEIGFNLKTKQDKIKAVAAHKENTNIDVVPNISHLCRDVKSQYKDQHGASKSNDPWYGTAKCIIKGSRNPSYTTLATFLDFYKVSSPQWDMLNKLCMDDWFFDTVLGVTESAAPVYDFVVPGTHSFSAGGFINHNTRVLAGKVAYTMNELGIPASAILATSFTRKASAELVQRCKDYGAVLSSKEDSQGFGTTHSIAGNLLNTKAQGFKHPNYIGAAEGYKQTTLFRLAMQQVKMGPLGIPAPAPTGFWDLLSEDKPNNLAPVPVAPQDAGTSPLGTFSEDPAEAAEFQAVLRDVTGYLRWAAGIWPGQKGSWARDAGGYLMDALNYGATPANMNQDQKANVNEILSSPWLVKKGQPLTNYRVAGVGKHSFDLFAEDVPVAPRSKSGFDLFAADDPVPGDVPMPRSKSNKMDEYTYFKTPARQWFNLGATLTVGEPPVAIPMGEFRQIASILKGKGVTPSQAWTNGVEGYLDPQDERVAVYGAYEWLKGPTGETKFVNLGDMDDLLIDAVKALRGSSTVRRQVQSQFKVLLIDEAQDLNRIQHLMFGLMAGYLDPKTMKPWPDGHMTADTMALIGDDKQAIYEFRGADPEEFISKSNMVENGGDFQTKLLDTNFRSGEAIVQAANKLIAYNKRQVPMTCKANTDRNGQGRIISRHASSVNSAAVSVAEEIADIKESDATENFKYKNFGVALRSNAEAYIYGLEMLKRNIPFKSNAQFFNDPNTKALIGWLTIVDKGLDGPVDTIEDAIRDCVRAPVAMIGKATFERIETLATGSWARWLVDGGWAKVYGAKAKMTPSLEHFALNLEAVSKMTGTPTEIVNQLLELRGLDGKTTKESMVENVMEDDKVLIELAAAAEGGIVTKEQIAEQALAPIQPLLSLVEGREDLGAAVAFIHKLKNVNSKIASSDSEKEINRDAVTIGTMHSWKGLEVDTMYIPMVGGKFPRASSKEGAPDTPALASERRLAYVAITRAEQRAVILDIPGGGKPSRSGVPGTPDFSSQFLKEACIEPERGPEALTQSPAAKLARKWPPERLAALRVR